MAAFTVSVASPRKSKISGRRLDLSAMTTFFDVAGVTASVSFVVTTMGTANPFNEGDRVEPPIGDDAVFGPDATAIFDAVVVEGDGLIDRGQFDQGVGRHPPLCSSRRAASRRASSERWCSRFRWLMVALRPNASPSAGDYHNIHL
jgi:hypothetical protein